MAVYPLEMNITFAPSITGPPERRFRASRIGNHQWEIYHNEIRTKYVDENLTLERLMQYMWRVHRFGPTKKQYTSYLSKQKIRKFDKFSPFELGSPQSVNPSSDPQSPGSECQETNSSNSPRDDSLLNESMPDFDHDAIQPRLSRKIRRVGSLRGSPLAQHSSSHFYDIPFDDHILNALSGNDAGDCQNDPASIRRSADIALFFLDYSTSRRFQQLFDRLQDKINSRPADLHCHDYHVFSLLRLTRLLIYDSWSNHLRRLSCRISLLVCRSWNLDYDILSRGRMLIRLIAMSLLYSGGKSITADDLPKRSEGLGHSDNPPRTSAFMDHIHQNCFRFIGACHKVTSEADWSHMLLGLHLHQPHQILKELQIDHVAKFILPLHIDGLAKILQWCVTILGGQEFHDLRQNVIDWCYSTVNSQEFMITSDMITVERHVLHYYFVTIFWRARGRAASALTNVDSDEIAVLSVFRTFLDDFALSEFDILHHLVELFISQLVGRDCEMTTLRHNPRYLDPEVLGHLSHRFSDREYPDLRKELASWWLSCWIWSSEPSNVSDFLQTALAARLGDYTLTLILQGLEETHSSNRARVRKEQQLADVEVLPTLYEGIAGSRQVRLSGSRAERYSYNMTSSPTFSKSQDQRSSGGSSDYAVFAKTGTVKSISPSKRSPTLPSEGFQDLRGSDSDVYKRWGFSISSKSTGGNSDRRSTGRRSISGFGIREHIIDTIFRHCRTPSNEIVQEDTHMQDFLHHDRKCMSPRVMTDNSLME